MQDPRFVSSPYVCMQNILIPNECIFLPVLNSYVCRIRHSIPNWNTLFKKGCASAAAQMSPHSTGIACQYYPCTIYSKLEYFVQKRLCICGSADVAALHRHHQLVPSYHTPPGVQFLYVGRTLRYFCPLRSLQLDKSKTSYYPPPPLPLHHRKNIHHSMYVEYTDS